MYTVEKLVELLGYIESPVKQKKRLEILKRTQAIVIREGLYPITMSDIAQEIGISKRSLYYYYKNKEELAVDVQIMVMNEYIYGMDVNIDPEVTGYEQLCQLIDYLGERVQKYAKEIKFITAFDYYFFNGYPDKKYADYIRTIDEDLELKHILEKGIEDGTLRVLSEDLDTFSMTIYQTVFAYAQKLTYREKSMLSEEPERRGDLDTFFTMLRASLKAV